MDKKNLKIFIKGVVQGVGFRPFVFNAAQKYNINGYVLNNSNGVEVAASGRNSDLEKFLNYIKTSHPVNAKIDFMETVEDFQNFFYSGFIIKDSRLTYKDSVKISPDIGLCKDCLKELFDKNNRRYFYPFITCTNCGPRYTIINNIPYDRKNTTMKSFAMCKICESEYKDVSDRRFHAQPNGCHNCGPVLELLNNKKKLLLKAADSEENYELIKEVAGLLKRGKIVAIKGLGGFHLACDAANDKAVMLLRQRKYRECKPFAVMAADIKMAEKIAPLATFEKRAMESAVRPIVIVQRNTDQNSEIKISNSVAPGNRFIGLMLPYAPVHYMIFNFVDRPLVMTSGNISDEPISFTNEDAADKLSGIADYFLINNRAIFIRNDDSVITFFSNRQYFFRRSRGIAPLGLDLPKSSQVNIAALGAELKNTICLIKNNSAFISQHIGDLKNISAFNSFLKTLKHMITIFSISPEVIACDMHPSYLNSRFANDIGREYPELKDVEIIPVQHHHAHMCSAMADNGLDEKVIGIILDGTGYGLDGTIWGGEVLVGDFKTFERAASLAPVEITGGDRAAQEVWKIALSYLYKIHGDNYKNKIPPALRKIGTEKMDMALWQLKNNINLYTTTSCGRLFDALSALCGVCIESFYEGQAAVEFEQLFLDDIHDYYKVKIVEKDNRVVIDSLSLFKLVLDDIFNNVSSSEISTKFHRWLARALADCCLSISKKTGLTKVVLSGGCFMNLKLLGETVKIVESCGLRVYYHKNVPANDGGISFGQAVIASRLRG